MDFDEYQVESATTAKNNIKNNVPYLALGLTGEAGEVAELVKKAIRDTGGSLDTDKLKKELGDVLWYVSQLASHYQIDLSDVANGNLNKLFSRRARGVIGGSGDDR